MSKNELKNRMEHFSAEMENVLNSLLSQDLNVGEQARPPRLLAAMRHGVLGGGKRLRPFLLTEAARLCRAAASHSQIPAVSLEMVHCYSLIHDDLPAMDDDDLRRGQPTVHRAFDEATAILAGDALLTLSFEILAGCGCDADIRLELITGLSKAAGLGGMIGGQMLDIEAETSAPDAQSIRQLQAMKTGALLRYACEAGAIIGRADEERRQALITYGETVGLAFQLADDLLDVTATSEAMGKATGKDAEAGKATLVGLHGVDAVREMLADAVAQAEAALDVFGEKAATLRALARFIAERES